MRDQACYHWVASHYCSYLTHIQCVILEKKLKNFKAEKFISKTTDNYLRVVIRIFYFCVIYFFFFLENNFLSKFSFVVKNITISECGDSFDHSQPTVRRLERLESIINVSIGASIAALCRIYVQFANATRSQWYRIDTAFCVIFN